MATLSDVQRSLKGLSGAEAREILQRFKVNTTSQLDESDYDAVIRAAEGGGAAPKAISDLDSGAIYGKWNKPRAPKTADEA